MRQRLVTLGAVLWTTTLASSADAHHSHPYFYDQCKSVTVEGRIESVEFKSPHTWIVLKLDDGTGYSVDWASLRGLTNNGVIGPAKAALVFGSRVAVTGNRIRTTAEIREHFPEFKGVTNPNTLDPTLIRRVDDSFRWALPPSPTNCGGK